MPRYLDTRGMASLAIAVCDRCKMKRSFVSLMSDTNFPGLRVCDQGCLDEKDPYRLPARKTERINLRFPRPDESVATVNNFLATTAEDPIPSALWHISTGENNDGLINGNVNYINLINPAGTQTEPNLLAQENLSLILQQDTTGGLIVEE